MGIRPIWRLSPATTTVPSVGSGGGLDMDVRPAEATGREATFQVAFLNQSPAPAVVALAARDSADALCLHIEPPAPVVVPTGATAALATVHVRPKRRGTRGRPQRYEIEFRGRRMESEQPSTPDLVAHARFTYVPRPAWLRRLPVSTLALMLTLLPLRQRFPGMRAARARIQQQALPRTVARGLARVLPVISAGVVMPVISAGMVIHAWNAFNYPRYQGDEGVYVSAAWAVAHGRIYHYTYDYGHPPLGWALIAAWYQLTGGLFGFGTAINTGRIFMVGIYAVSALFVYLIARRLSGSAATALLATTLFSFSPLSVYYQREVLLDNIATFWLLLALYLQVASASRMRYIVGSALAFGLGFLCKETMIVFFPVFVYGTWLQASAFQRRYLLITFSYLTLALVSAFVLLAALKDELFPSGTLLGGTNPHVSMITTYLQQIGRGSNQGSFLQQWSVWQHATGRSAGRSDGLLLWAGVGAMAGNLWLSRRRPSLRMVALLPLIYLLFLVRGGVTLAYYVIPLIPFLALNAALLAHSVIARVARVRWWAHRALARWMAPAVLLGATALLVPYDLQRNKMNLTANEVGLQVAAMQWVGQHVPRSAMIVASHYDWLDMRTTGGVGASYGVPFDHVQMYWAVVTDPAIGSGVFHNDWNNVDYIMADSDMIVDANNFHMKLLLSALQHAIPIKTFQNRLYWVTIYQVQHRHSPAGMGGQSSGPEMPLPIVNNGPTTLYFAEGYTGRRGSKGGTTVDESLAVHNANPFPATVTITYLFEHGSPLAVTRTILPDTTLHESVNADIGPDKAAAAIVSSAAHLTAERIMRRVDAPGPSVVAGNAGLDQAFYFATGDTGPTVQEYLAVANPGSSDAHVRVTFVVAESSTPGSSETFTVPANGRATWNIRSDLRAMAAKPAGLIVTSDQPIVVERVRYVSATAVQTATAVAHQTATAVAQQTATAVAHQRAIAVAHQRATAVAHQRAIAVAHQRATAVAQQTATAAAQQTATAVAQQTAIAVAHQRAIAVAHQRATAVAHQRAIAVAHQRATAVAYQRAIADAYQRAIAVAHQQATAVAQQTATAAAHQTATAAAQQTATATAHQAATAVAQQTATATAHQTATAVAAHQTATVVAQQTATATAHQTATAVAQQTATAAAQQIATATAH